MERKILKTWIDFSEEGSANWEKSILSVLEYYQMTSFYYTNKLKGLIKGFHAIYYSNGTIYDDQVFDFYDELLDYIYPEFVWKFDCQEGNYYERTMSGVLLTAPAYVGKKSRMINTYLIKCAKGKSVDWLKMEELNLVDDNNIIVDVLNEIGYSGKATYKNVLYSDRETFLNDIFKEKNIIWGIETVESNCDEDKCCLLVAVY